jgi:hypothetical protein
MRHYSQFEHFDPLNGEMPWAPFHEAGNIAMRARSTLRLGNRSVEDIQTIATDAAYLIEHYFEHEREVKLEEIRNDRNFRFLESDDEGNFIDFVDEAYDEYDIHTSDNTPELDALVEALAWGFDPKAVEVNEVQEYEYFAVYALCILAEYVRDLNFKLKVKPFEYVPREDKQYSPSEVASLSRKLINATEAVCFSEKLRDIERVERRYQEKIEKLQAGAAVQITKADYDRLREEIKQEEQAEAQALRRERSEANNDIRHQDNRNIKQSVLDDFAKNPRLFDSAEKAADHYVEVLEKQGHQRSHRTVADWIRAFARNNNIRFR